MIDIFFSELLGFLKTNYKVINYDRDIKINYFKPVSEALENSLVFIDKERKDKVELLKKTKASVAIIDFYPDFNTDVILVIVENPRLEFTKLLSKFFNSSQQFGIHSSSVIHPSALIKNEVFIGANCYIGNSKVGRGTIIYGNTYIYDNVIIGENVKINAGCIIGAEGFGYYKDENGFLCNFPHIGGVIIEDNVEIGCNTCVDRGSLGNTIIKRGAKIDNLVHIAHNVIIGENTMVIADSMIGGSTIIGKNSWIAPSSSIRDAVNIGMNVTVGMGAVVTKSIPDNEIWTGNPAKPLNELIEIQNKLKKL